MKKTIKLLIVVFAVVGFHLSYAAGGNTPDEKPSQTQEPKAKKGQETIEDDVVSLPSEKDTSTFETYSDESDSADDDSLSKYNFIFKFFYKYNYEEAGDI